MVTPADALPPDAFPPAALPIEDALPDLRHALARAGAAVLQAPPGAGKTTRVPLALLDEPWLRGRRIVMLEPRRLAARAAAARMVETVGEEPGGLVGYRIRHETRIGPRTRVEVVTEGVLTRMLRADPALEGAGLVIFDELHERSVHADLGLALTLQSRAILRDDLRLLVMSATLDGEPVAALLGQVPIVSSEGRHHPVETRYLPARAGRRLEAVLAAAVRSALAEEPGDVLAFLPGAGEIRRTASLLAGVPADVIPLHPSTPRWRRGRRPRCLLGYCSRSPIRNGSGSSGRGSPAGSSCEMVWEPRSRRRPRRERTTWSRRSWTAAHPRAVSGWPHRSVWKRSRSTSPTISCGRTYSPGVVALRRRQLGAIALQERALHAPGSEAVARVLLEAITRAGVDRLPWTEPARRVRARLAFLHRLDPDWPDVSDEALARDLGTWLGPAVTGLRRWDDLERLDLGALLLARIPWDRRSALDAWAPTHVEVPSGSRIPVDYGDPAGPVLAVRLQELFGLTEAPRIGRGRVPLTLHLLSPAGRPMQVTRDLAGFWQTTYFEVRKDLKGRYPKHHWPDDPLAAEPTRHAKRRHPRGT